MKLLFLSLLLTIQFAWGTECPVRMNFPKYYINHQNTLYIKITSSVSCRDKIFLPENLTDNTVEIYRGTTLLSKFYSRTITYSTKSGVIAFWDLLNNHDSFSRESNFILFDSKAGTLSNGKRLITRT